MGAHHHQGDEDQKGGADVRFGESVHRVEYPRTGDEGPQDRKGKGSDDQHQVPELQGVSFFLDDHRVQKGGAGQPGHQGSVFHRVPGPITAPAQFHVGPVAAQDHPGGQEEPGNQGPAPGGQDPVVVSFAAEQGAHGKGKGDVKAHVTQVQRRGVEDHPWVLQQRVEPPAFAGNGEQPLEGVGPADQQEQQKKSREGQDQQGIGQGLVVAFFVAQGDHGGENHQDHLPQEQRTFQPTPNGGDLVKQGQVGTGVVGHKADRKVIGGKGINQAT